VLEGRPVDWSLAESSADAPDRGPIRQLKVLAVIAELHRGLAARVLEADGERPERWGHLKLLERIGSGSYGDVYRAWDTKLDREVALKLLRRDRARDEGGEVLTEARLLARVRHPNVATVFDADEIEGRVGIWMEFIHGRTLEQILSERGWLETREVTRIGIELCRALTAVHDASLVHRDIKAQNVMQTEDGRLVLMDFGTGRELEDSPAPMDAAGTPLYLAPEIFEDSEATVRSDIYGAGVLLFHLLSGVYPVSGGNLEEIRQAHASGRRLSLEARLPRIDKPLAAAIRRAIEPDPAKRFESANRMLAALESARSAGEARKRRRTWLAVAAGFVAAIALVVVSGAGRRETSRDGRSPAGRQASLAASPEKRAVQMPRLFSAGTPSPDGRFLPYSEADTLNLALYEFATGASRTLTSGGDGGNRTFADGESIVSADSSRIAYSWDDGACQCTQLRVIDAMGENVRVLYGDRGMPEIIPAEWSADGEQILGTRRRTSGETDVVLVSARDGSVRLIRTVASGPDRVSLSPDGRYVAYDRAKDSNGFDRGIFLSATAVDQEIPVVTGPTNDSDPMWTPDGSGLVFSSTRTGTPGLWLQAIKDGRSDGKSRLLDKEMGSFITLTRRGSLFYSHPTELMDVYTAPIDPSTGDVIGEPTNGASRVLGSNISADWSPNGETLAFAAWRSPRRNNILVLHSMRTGQERELELDRFANLLRWSPDGRTIKIGGGLVDPETGKVVPAKEAALPSWFGPPGKRYSFEWDPDGRHGYLSDCCGDQKRIFKVDVQTGKEELLFKPPPDSVGDGVSISPDGRWLATGFYLRPTKTRHLILVPTTGGSSREILDRGRPVAGEAAAWTRDGRQLLVVRGNRDSEGKGQGELWAVPVEGGPPRSLGLKMYALRDVRVSPDGTRISFTSGYPEANLWVFENFLPPTPMH